MSQRLLRLKHNWRKMPPYWRQAVQILCFGYLLLVLCLSLLPIFFDGWARGSFGLSWLASAWASVFFFTFLGITTFLISIRRPQDELLESRVWYLFAVRNISDPTRQFVEQQIRKMAACCPRAEYKIRLLKVDTQSLAVEIEVEGDIVHQNMFHDCEMVDPEFRIWLTPDLVPEAVVGTGNPLAEILRSETIVGSNTAKHVNGTKRIFREAPHYDATVTLKIPPASVATHKFTYRLWCAASEGYFVSFRRFSEVVSVEIVNGSTEDLLFTGTRIAALDKQGERAAESIKIGAAQTGHLPPLGSFEPGEQFVLRWQRPS